MVKRILSEPIWLRRPDFADVLVGRQALEGLKPLGKVAGHHEDLEMLFELGMCSEMVAGVFIGLQLKMRTANQSRGGGSH